VIAVNEIESGGRHNALFFLKQAHGLSCELWKVPRKEEILYTQHPPLNYRICLFDELIHSEAMPHALQ
jgi:hypothetical protein